MGHWALLCVVEFKRNLGMQLEMKRDSSGSMDHWGARVGRGNFGAGFF